MRCKSELNYSIDLLGLSFNEAGCGSQKDANYDDGDDYIEGAYSCGLQD